MTEEDAPAAGRWTGPALFAVACAVCVAFAAGIAGRPLDDLVGFVSDDAFYYLQIARNLADTGRSTFDGIHPTNGYHPGWMAVVTALASVIDDRETLLRAALWTSFVLHLGAAAMLVRLCARFVSGPWPWVLGALWAVNPLPLTFAMQGVEAPLQVLALVVALHALVRTCEDAAAPPATRRLVQFGAALGLLFWARTDAIVLAPLAIAVAALASGTRAAARTALVAGGTFALCVAPWIAWSYAATGSCVQDSGEIKRLWAERANEGDVIRMVPAWRFFAGRWLGVPASLLTAAPAVASPFAAAVLAAIVGFPLVRALRRREDRGLAAATAWLVAATVTLGLVYGAYFTDQMVWYHVVPGVALFVVTTLWAARLLRRVEALQRPAVQVAAAAALVVLAMIPLARYRERMPYEYPWQRDVLASQRQFDAIVAPDKRIGCFNAGIPAYFGTRTVVNLDGLVNHDLVGVYRRGEFDRWLAEARIDFIADEPLALGRAQKLTKGPIPLTPVSSAPLHGWLSPTRYLWKVEAR